MLGTVNGSDLLAAGIEALVMPGEVVSSHADIEEECSSCHKAFSKTEQNALCLDCHEDVAEDLDAMQGFHGLWKEVAVTDCATCHSDHEGRDADIVQLDESGFDHEITDFRLLGAHLDVECEGCHLPETKHRNAPGDCNSCHEDDDAHDGALGESCADCHSAIAWSDIWFDHDTTDYPLIGGHRDVACLDCHENNVFDGTADDCYSCHAGDDAHEGRSGENCGNCHNPKSWTDTSFDHARDTQFALEGSHASLSCNDCHSDDPFADQLELACISCHTDDDSHDGHFGPECGSCHTANEWTESVFDHGRDTDHALNGAHESIECIACHIEPIFETALQSACNDCHLDDDVHEGEQGTSCADCHNETSWQEDVLFDHDLTRFPLLGTHADEECSACHDSHVFTDAQTACVACHQEDDPHKGRFDDSCGSCHNPVSWDEWRFDHGRQTDFILDGAHSGVACDGCHRQSLASMKRLSGRCGDCHRSEDIHDGEFGSDCGRCHSADSFSEVRSLQ